MGDDMLKVGLDLTPLHSDLRTGAGGRVAQAFFEWLTASPQYEVMPYSRGEFPRQSEEKENWKSKLWDRWLLGWNFRNTDIDVLQVLDPLRVPPFSPAPVVTLVLDLIPYLYRERYQEKLFDRYLYWRMKSQISNSDYIVTPSSTTAEDLEMSFGLDNENIHVIYPGIDRRRFYPRPEEKVKKTARMHGINAPYFLMVADLSKYNPIKNLEDVIKNWDHRVLSEVQLVIAGKEGVYSRKLEEMWGGEEDNLIFTGYVDDEQLANLYTGAQLLIFPSRYEGFGFPVLEAMACGTRPAVREVGALKEVSGDSAITLDDNNYTEELMDVLPDYVGDFKVNDDCVEYAEQFSWKKTTKQLGELYREASEVRTAE